MPKQSRGFWACNFCGLTFDLLEECTYHETNTCLQATSRGSLQYSSGMPPSSSVDRSGASSSATANANIADLAAPSQPTLGYDVTGRKNNRRVSLLGLHEAAGSLMEVDELSCRHIELFESTEQYTIDAQGTRTVIGQVGVRCLSCSAIAPGSLDFPRSIRNIGDCVGHILERHLTICSEISISERHILDQAVRQRLRNRAEGGQLQRDEEEGRVRLIEYCASRCQQWGITDIYPEGTGVIFEDVIGQSKYSAYESMASPGKRSATTTRMDPPSSRSMPASTAGGAARQSSDTQNSASLRMRSPSFHLDPGTQKSHAQYSDTKASSKADAYARSGYHDAPGQTLYDSPTNYPFIQEANGDWVCKFCAPIHPHYRDPNYLWAASNNCVPPPSFIDQHLAICRMYHQISGPAAMAPFGSPSASGQSRAYGSSYMSAGYGHAGSQGYDMSSVDQSHAYGLPDARSSGYIYSDRQPSSQYGSYSAQPASLYAETSRPDPTDPVIQQAIDFLTANDKSVYDTEGNPLPEEEILVLEEDKLLLTDYFYHLMKQLRLVRFSEADRKTRGGKREKIQIGYGGLQCVHCAEAQNSRKFFWSNVDRLANSFAEIPGHVLKCRKCPQQFRDSLNQLKQIHPTQMSRLPRGSQKVFFRRMWRRLHDEDPSPPPVPKKTESESFPVPTTEPASVNLSLDVSEDVKPEATANSPGTSGSEGSVVLLDRSTKEAAKALADSAIHSSPPSPSSRVLLAVQDDKEWLSDTDCFIRKQIEVFCATKEDVEVARSDRKYPIHEGQVGIRCIHCAISKKDIGGAKGQAVAFPFSISGIYESVREFQRLHLDTCQNIPSSARSKFVGLTGSSSLSSVLRKYYVLAAKALGLVDTKEGIRAGGDAIPLGSQAAFAFSEGPSTMSEELLKEFSSPSGSVADTENVESSGKRRNPPSPAASDDSKRKRSA